VERRRYQERFRSVSAGVSGTQARRLVAGMRESGGAQGTVGSDGPRAEQGSHRRHWTTGCRAAAARAARAGREDRGAHGKGWRSVVGEGKLTDPKCKTKGSVNNIPDSVPALPLTANSWTQQANESTSSL